MAKIAVLERKCTGCGLCAKNCPFGAIEKKEDAWWIHAVL